MVYATFPFADIWWDYEDEFVEFQARDATDAAELRAGLDKGLELLRARAATRWLADIQRLGAISAEDQDWLANDWFLRARALGLQFLAIIPPDSAVAAMSLKRVMGRVDGIATAYVGSPDTAREWLRASGLNAA